MSDEVLYTDPKYRRLHQGVRRTPEDVWDDLRAYLCADDHHPADLQYVDLVEDLMFWHAASFIERLEGPVADCPRVGMTAAWATVGGTVAPGVDRFHGLQRRLRDELGLDPFATE